MEWVDLRASLVSRFEAWLDVACQSEEGRGAIERLQANWLAEPNAYGLPMGSISHVPVEPDWETDQNDLSQASRGGASPLAEASRWLLELVAELAALRHELKLQTRGSRSVIESFGENLRLMEATSTAMIKRMEIPVSSSKETDARTQCESLIDLDEGVGRLVHAAQNLVQDLSDTMQEGKASWITSAPCMLDPR